MDIKEVREEKRKTEEAIRIAIHREARQFTERTGCAVSGIDVEVKDYSILPFAYWSRAFLDGKPGPDYGVGSVKITLDI